MSVTRSRSLLHRKKLDEFRGWLILSGWTLEKVKGDYEVLRMRNAANELLIVHSAHSGDHLTTTGISSRLALKFINRGKE